MYHHDVTYLVIFTCDFADRVNVLLLFLFTIFQKTTFGIFVPNKAAEVAHTCAHFKPMTQAKTFSVFEIVLVQNQNNFRSIGVIPTSRAKLFYRIKI